MSGLHRLLARVGALFTGRQLDRDLNEEVAHHIQLRAEALERAGASRDAAIRTAIDAGEPCPSRSATQ